MLIIPSILVHSEEEFIKQVNAVQNNVDLIQIDIADGKFVPNTTWAEPQTIETYARMSVELHLMVNDPLSTLEKWIDVKNIKRVFIHCESPKNVKRALEFAKINSWEKGLAINPDTDIEKIEPYLNLLDAVMFMGVNPGFQGQGFAHSVLNKIKDFKIKHPEIFVGLDGAVNFATLPEILAVGVDAVCPGSAIFGNQIPPKENIEKMKKIINRLTK